MNRLITSVAIMLVLILLIPVRSDGQPPKREMRSAWLTTVWGLDWPGTKIPSGGGELYINMQKQQLIRILDSMQVAGLNAVFFQVRPECDALYRSSYEPWSAHLVATRGMDPGWDPLEFAIEESHKRGLELHAWLNPYRFESVAGKYAGQPGDYRQTNPEWVLSYSGGGSILDPGNPEVRNRISDIVKEIVAQYDVDGIVFDDYFYAYGGTPSSLDQYSQSRWKPGSMSLDDWRRDNVNRMVSDVYHAIQEVKPWVTFGVSPFGIWTLDPQVAAANGLTLPQGITGMDAYKSIYCDPVAWLREGTVDYISPQIYWPTTSTGQDYKKLAPWWSEVVSIFNRHLYVSHTLSSLDPADYPPPVALKSGSAEDSLLFHSGMSRVEYLSLLTSGLSVAGLDPSEFGLQIQWNRNADRNQAPGSVFFRATMFFTKGFMNYLRTNEYSTLALPPVKPWNLSASRELPENIRIEGDFLSWDSSEENVRYAIYAVPEGQTGPDLFETGKFLLGMSYQKSIKLTPTLKPLTGHTFAVALLDRNGREFPPVVMGQSPLQNSPVSLVYPENMQSVYPGFIFRWDTLTAPATYILEVSSDDRFEKLLYRRDVRGNAFESVNIGLKEDSVYYWRVLSRMTGSADEVSEAREFLFKALPRPTILYPIHESVAVEVTPVIRWDLFDEGFSYRLQISTNNSFTGVIFDRQNIDATQLDLPAGVIFSYSTYYMRLQAVDGDSVSLWSHVVKFSTVNTPPSVPVILSPAEGEVAAGPGAVVAVKEDPLARSFTFQLSTSTTFPWNNRIQQSVDAPSSSLVLTGLNDGTWYVRARANYSSSLFTDWSPVVSFSLLTTYAGDIAAAGLRLFCQGYMTHEPMRVNYSLPGSSMISVYVTDLTGKRIFVAEQALRVKGDHIVMISPESIPPGYYLLTLETEFGRKTVRFVR